MGEDGISWDVVVKEFFECLCSGVEEAHRLVGGRGQNLAGACWFEGIQDEEDELGPNQSSTGMLLFAQDGGVEPSRPLRVKVRLDNFRLPLKRCAEPRHTLKGLSHLSLQPNQKISPSGHADWRRKERGFLA